MAPTALNGDGEDSGYVAMTTSATITDGTPSPHHKSPLWRVVGNFVNTVVGAGIVGLPFALQRAGFWAGVGSMCGACFLTHVSLVMLIETATRLRVNTFEDLCEVSFGRAGFVLVTCCLLVFDFGASLSFLIICTDSLSKVVVQAFPDVGSHDGPVRDACLLASSPLLLFLCAKRDLSGLERFSFLSVGLVVLLAAYVVTQLSEGVASGAIALDEPLPVISAGLPAALGTIAFSFVNNDCAFLLFQTLRNPTPARWARLSGISLSLALVACVLFSTFGYLIFRDGDLTSNVLNDFPSHGLGIALVRAAYAMTMALTFPSTFFVVRHVCNELCFRGTLSYSTVQENHPLRHYGLTAVIFVLLVLLTLAYAGGRPRSASGRETDVNAHDVRLAVAAAGV